METTTLADQRRLFFPSHVDSFKYKEQIHELLTLGLPMGSIAKIVNAQLEKPASYNTYRYYITHDEELKRLRTETV